MPFRMPPMPLLFIIAVKDICAINTFEKLLNILFSEVYCWYFGFTTLLFSATITDKSLYEVLNLFPRWPLVFRSFLFPPLTDWWQSEEWLMWKCLFRRKFIGCAIKDWTDLKWWWKHYWTKWLWRLDMSWNTMGFEANIAYGAV